MRVAFQLGGQNASADFDGHRVEAPRGLEGHARVECDPSSTPPGRDRGPNPGKGRRWADPFTLPDDIFNECNIQFRLVSFNELPVDKERFELKRLDGRAEKLLCDLAYEIRPRLNSLDASAKALPGVRGDLPRVIFNWTVQPTACNQLTPVVDVACDPEDSGCSDAGFVVVGLENLGGVNADLVLSHELGHVLSMSHRTKSECSAEKLLMCETVGGLAPKIKFECDEARAWALKYRDAYLSGGG